jgi:hypothetical protein
MCGLRGLGRPPATLVLLDKPTGRSRQSSSIRIVIAQAGKNTTTHAWA